MNYETKVNVLNLNNSSIHLTYASISHSKMLLTKTYYLDSNLTSFVKNKLSFTKSCN